MSMSRNNSGRRWRNVVHECCTRATAKLKDTAAFTLTEVLATVIVIGLVSGGLATAVTVGARQFTRSMAMSESQMLCSSLRQDIENDLSYTKIVLGDEASGDLTGYVSLHHADKTQYLKLKALDDNGQPVNASGNDVTGEGQLALCSDDGKVKNRLLGKAAYNNGLKACVKKLQYIEDKRLYVVELAIYSDASGSEPLADETFSVKALNNAKLEIKQG